MANMNPLACDDEPGYIPTVDVIRLVRANFERAYIERQVERDGAYEQNLNELDQACSVEIACRELLASQRWLYSNP